MLVPEQTKLAQFSFEDIEKYGVFNDIGDIVGAKDDAPADFKKAYEYDKKLRNELWERGLYT